MKNLSLILRIVAIVAAIVATTLFFISKGKLADKEAQLTQTKQILSTTQAELSETNKSLEKTESELKTERASLAKTKDELEEVRSELFAAQEEADRNEEKLTQARNDISEMEATAEDLRAELVATEEELAAASREGEINQLNERIAELEKTNEELEFELEAKTAVAEAAAAQKEAASLKGIKVIDTSVSSLLPGKPIDRLKLETTVNSVSAADGLIVLKTSPDFDFFAGQTITLVQNMKSVGKVQIESVEDNYAVGNILPGSSGTKKLSSGSTVQLLL